MEDLVVVVVVATAVDPVAVGLVLQKVAPLHANADVADDELEELDDVVNDVAVPPQTPP